MSRPLPGSPVLVDTRCCSRCDRELFARGDRGTVRRIIPSGHLQVQVHRTGKTVTFSPGQLIVVRNAEPTYPCCLHCGCDSRRGHSQPCTGCGQTVVDGPDRLIARAMNTGGAA